MLYELIPKDATAYQWSPEIPDAHVKLIGKKYIFIDKNGFIRPIVKGDYIIIEEDGHTEVMAESFFKKKYKRKN